MISDLCERIDESVRPIRARCALQPAVAVVLGTGSSGLADAVEVQSAIPFSGVPRFVEPTVESPAGRLVLGELAGTPVTFIEGRRADAALPAFGRSPSPLRAV